MKRTILSLLVGLLVLSACKGSKNKPENGVDNNPSTVEQQTVGGEKDDHGCLTAAGETWSELKQNCIQVFNTVQRLNPVATNTNEAVISAFVLFDDDESKVEVFLPNYEETIILSKGTDDTYQNETIKFTAKDASCIVGSPNIFEPDCKSPEQIKLANPFCRFMEITK